MDGEIDLKSCVKVYEFDVEKNYGFQIQVSISVTGQSLLACVCYWFSSLYSLSFISVNHTRSLFLLDFFLVIPLSWLTSLSVSLPLFPLHLARFQLSFIISIWSRLCHIFCVSSLTCFLFCCADTGGRVHTVCHDGWDQAELDRGFKEECSAQQLSRPHTVMTV